MLGCTVPPCSRCICQQGYDGDGHTCTIAAPPPPPPAPEILGSRTQPTPIQPGAEVHGAIEGRGQPGFYTLTVTTGVAYTITVTLGSLDDSVLEVWKGPRTAPTLAAMNDDANGGLGSQVDWTPDSPGDYFIIVRGFSQTQRGSYTITIATDSGPSGPDHGGDGNGDPCNGGAVLSQPSGVIDFSNSYDDNAACSWKITCRGRGRNPHVHFTAFDTEMGFDFLNLYSGENAQAPAVEGVPARGLSGTMPATVDFTSAANSMYMQFTSDNSVAGQGFSLRYDCTGGGRPQPPHPPAPAPAQPIRVGQTVQGNLAQAGDVDFYTFQATAGTAPPCVC